VRNGDIRLCFENIGSPLTAAAIGIKVIHPSQRKHPMSRQVNHLISEPERTPWGQVFLLVGAGVLAAFQLGKVSPVLPVIRIELGMSLFLAGWLLSSFSVTGLLFGSITGAVADTFGHRRFIMYGLFCQAAASFAGSLSSASGFLLMTRVVEGFGFLMIVVAVPALIFQVTRIHDLRLSLSVWSCYVPAGVAGIMLLSPLLTDRFGWRGLWQINSLVLAVYAFGLAKATDGLTVKQVRKVLRWKQILRDILLTSSSRGPLILSGIFGSYALQWITVMGFLPTLFIEDHVLSQARASVLTAVMVAMNIPGNLLGGWLLHRGFRRWRLMAVASLIIGLCSLVIYSPHLPFVICFMACLLFSFIGGVVPASLMSGAPVYAPSPDLVASTNGLLIQGSQLGQVVGPPALGLIVSTAGGWEAAPWLLGGAAAMGIMLSVLLAKMEK